MVFFTCNACGESLKKASVEKHYLTKCRACEVLSCIDCGKDFYGDGYKEHTSCISENEKYGGKDYKAMLQKGVVKQSSWMEIVRIASSDTSLKPAVRDALKRIVDAGYDNIPRKKAKFVNFLGNSLRIRGDWLVNEIWDVIDSHATAQKTASSEPKTEKEEKKETSAVPEAAAETVVVANGKSKTKKERKKEKRKVEDDPVNLNRAAEDGRRKRKRQGDPLEDQPTTMDEREVDDQPKKKKKKKRKEVAEEEGLEKVNNQVVEEVPSKKKKNKRRLREEGEGAHEGHPDTEGGDRLSQGATEGSEEDTEDRNGQHQYPKTKFPWESVITEVLQGAGGEMRMKKLKKKVLTEFMSRGGDPSLPTDEKVMAKFNKKVLKNPKLRVYKEMVHLKS